MATLLVTMLFTMLLAGGGALLLREINRPLDLAWRDPHFVAAAYAREASRALPVTCSPTAPVSSARRLAYA